MPHEAASGRVPRDPAEPQDPGIPILELIEGNLVEGPDRCDAVSYPALLRSADEHDALRRAERPEVLLHHIVLALPLDEVHPGDALGLGEAVDRPTEPVRDRPQRRG